MHHLIIYLNHTYILFLSLNKAPSWNNIGSFITKGIWLPLCWESISNNSESSTRTQLLLLQRLRIFKVYMLTQGQLFILSGSMVKPISSGWHLPSHFDDELSDAMIRGDKGQFGQFNTLDFLMFPKEIRFNLASNPFS